MQLALLPSLSLAEQSAALSSAISGQGFVPPQELTVIQARLPLNPTPEEELAHRDALSAHARLVGILDQEQTAQAAALDDLSVTLSRDPRLWQSGAVTGVFRPILLTLMTVHAMKRRLSRGETPFQPSTEAETINQVMQEISGVVAAYQARGQFTASVRLLCTSLLQGEVRQRLGERVSAARLNTHIEWLNNQTLSAEGGTPSEPIPLTVNCGSYVKTLDEMEKVSAGLGPTDYYHKGHPLLIRLIGFDRSVLQDDTMTLIDKFEILLRSLRIRKAVLRLQD